MAHELNDEDACIGIPSSSIFNLAKLLRLAQQF
jgi:hypothetical protein